MSCAIGWPFSIGETCWRAVRPELKLRYALGKVIISTDEGEREVPLEKKPLFPIEAGRRAVDDPFKGAEFEGSISETDEKAGGRVKMNMRVVNTLIKKDFKNCFSNKNLLASLAIPVGFCILYNYLFSGIVGLESTYVLQMCAIFAIAIVHDDLPVMIAEEKEKYTLRP